MKRNATIKGDAAWYAWADQEACAVRDALPDDLQDSLASLIVTLDPKPTPDEEQQEGDDEALLGLFVGPSFGEELETADPIPPVIRLFVENLRVEAQDNPDRFRQEVRTTLLHEIGHYLGLDEEELADRELD